MDVYSLKYLVSHLGRTQNEAGGSYRSGKIRHQMVHEKWKKRGRTAKIPKTPHVCRLVEGGVSPEVKRL